MRTNPVNRSLGQIQITKQTEITSKSHHKTDDHSSSHDYSYQNWTKYSGHYSGSHDFNKAHKGAMNGYKKNSSDLLKKSSHLAKKLGLNAKVSGSTSAHETAYEKDFDLATKGDWGSANASGKISVFEADVHAHGEAGIEDGKLYASGVIGAKVNIVHAQGNAKVKIDGVGELDVNADLTVGANGKIYGGIQIGKDGMHAQLGGKAFAGVEASVSGTWTSDAGASISAAAGLKAGVGIEGKLQVGLKDGKLDFKLNFGLALGVGFKLSINFSIDFNKLGQSIANFFGKLFAGNNQQSIDLDVSEDFSQFFNFMMEAMEKMREENEKMNHSLKA